MQMYLKEISRTWKWKTITDLKDMEMSPTVDIWVLTQRWSSFFFPLRLTVATTVLFEMVLVIPSEKWKQQYCWLRGEYL